MIPPLEDGVQPEGVHDCTFDELAEAFGRFQQTDRRPTLAAKLKAYLEEARRSGLVAAVVVGGSFVTAKGVPEDIDPIVVLRPQIDWESLRPFEYNAVSKRVVKRTFRFDVFAHPDGSPEFFKVL